MKNGITKLSRKNKQERKSGKIKFALVGSRTFTNYDILKQVMDLARKHGILKEIVSGGARGADSLAKKYAVENDVPYKEFPAQWDLYGKSAGFIRNKLIVDYCDIVIAFWDGKSRGTKDTIKLVKKAGKKIVIM